MKNKKCLAWLVDDNEINMFLLDSIVRRKGFFTKLFYDGLKVFEAYKDSIQENRPNIIFMDIMMPIMTGYESTKEIRKYELENNIPRTCIIAFTAYDNEAKIIADNPERGMDGCVTKPLCNNELIKLFKYLDKICK